ncbi:MAG: hypothetical protein JW744_04475 [Candidatus Diapherotrites archaeon]|uniref:Uncharacterized protein n=1 Tax=Candidatus Iainarchaeum sp. TaxID=3101447 RepID=A0A939C949_9ARCH|nr:hypothetical protein [Candidatus Diapherotrites archaeon]
MLWGGAWILVFLAFQTVAMKKIESFVSKNSLIEGLKSFVPSKKHRLDDFLKFLLAIAFAAIALAFLLGYYPFPGAEAPFYALPIFFVISWVVSLTASVKTKKPKTLVLRGGGGETALISFPDSFKARQPKTLVATGKDRARGFLMGAVFFTVGFIFKDIFYFHGLIGLGVCTMMATAWLLEDQKKPIPKKQKRGKP